MWALLLGVLTEEQLLSWGWRMPFLLSFVLLVFAVWLRRQPQGEPGLRGAPRRRRRGGADPARGRGRRPPPRHESVLEAGLKQRKGRAFFLALGLRFGQAGNSGLIQTFLVGYIATTLLDRPGRRHRGHRVRLAARLRHRARSSACSATASAGARSTSRCPLLTIVLAFPMMLLITSGNNACADARPWSSA